MTGKERQCDVCKLIYHFSVKHECAPVEVKVKKVIKKK